MPENGPQIMICAQLHANIVIATARSQARALRSCEDQALAQLVAVSQGYEAA